MIIYILDIDKKKYECKLLIPLLLIVCEDNNKNDNKEWDIKMKKT